MTWRATREDGAEGKTFKTKKRFRMVRLPSVMIHFTVVYWFYKTEAEMDCCEAALLALGGSLVLFIPVCEAWILNYGSNRLGEKWLWICWLEQIMSYWQCASTYLTSQRVHPRPPNVIHRGSEKQLNISRYFLEIPLSDPVRISASIF